MSPVLQCLLRSCARPSGACSGNRLPSVAAIDAFCQRRYFADDASESGDSPGGQVESERAASGAEASTSDLEFEAPTRRKGRRPTREEKGSWVGNTGFTDEVVKDAPVWPVNRPLWDPQSQLPWLNEPFNPVFESYKQLRKEQPEEFAKLLYREVKQDAPPREGAQKILEWEINVVFESGPLSGDAHPLNKKVKCRVYLRHLQAEFGLSEQALRHIALICGPRYNPKTGLLTLTSEKTHDREENRLHVVEMLHALVAEGQRAFPTNAS